MGYGVLNDFVRRRDLALCRVCKAVQSDTVLGIDSA